MNGRRKFLAACLGGFAWMIASKQSPVSASMTELLKVRKYQKVMVEAWQRTKNIRHFEAWLDALRLEAKIQDSMTGHVIVGDPGMFDRVRARAEQLRR